MYCDGLESLSALKRGASMLQCMSGRKRFGSVRFGSGLFENSSVRFGSVRFGNFIFPVRRGSACAFWTRGGSIRFGSVPLPRPVPADSRIKRFGSVWFGSVRPVRFGFFFIPEFLSALKQGASMLQCRCFDSDRPAHVHLCVRTSAAAWITFSAPDLDNCLILCGSLDNFCGSLDKCFLLGHFITFATRSCYLRSGTWMPGV